MKKFGALFLAAVLGGLTTAGIMELRSGDENSNVKVEYIEGLPVSQVALKNESGEIVPLDFTQVAEKVVPAVVGIRSTFSSYGDEGPQYYEFDPRDFFRDFGNPRQRQQMPPMRASGSGVIINSNGYIVTNNHVVKDAETVDVTLYDNTRYTAKVIGTDPDTDLALIKIDAKDLPFLPFVNSDQVKVGEWVLAVGNPFDLRSTVTAGIISAKQRNINIINPTQQTSIESFLQTDAAINPGNSGGALVNTAGGLVGINTAIASNTGSYAGYGFAVPANLVKKIVSDLIEFGEVQRGWLGVEIRNASDEALADKNLAVKNGAFVLSVVENSAAQKAGIREGDVITKIDDIKINSTAALIEYIGRHHPDDKLSVTVNRDGKELTLPVTLKAREAVKVVALTTTTLGAELKPAESDVLQKLNLSGGIEVTNLKDGRLSQETEMKKGFIITKVNNKRVNSVQDIDQIIASVPENEFIIFSGVYRGSNREYHYPIRK